jgi:uncharacterized repeat protein (TIGR01451 family)
LVRPNLINVVNSGNGPTTAGPIVQVVDTLPTGMTAVSIQGIGWLCQTSPTIGCNRSDALTAGNTYPPLTLTVNVAANAPSSVTNQASVSGGGGVATGSSVSDPTTIIAATGPAWNINKVHSGNFTQGQNGATYTITVSNSGGTPTTAGPIAQVIDTLPSGLTAVSMQGSGWLCQASPTIGCNRGDSLAAGASYPPLTLTVNVASNAPSSVTNQVSVSGANANDPTTINPAANVTLTLASDPTGLQVRIGSSGAYSTAPISQAVPANQLQTISARDPQFSSGLGTGYAFLNWSTGATVATTTVQPAANLTATASFKVACYSFTASVAPAGGGTVSVSPEGSLAGLPLNCYAPGTTVTVLATPASGYVNAGSAVTTVVVSAPKTTDTANFSLYPPPALSFTLTTGETVTGTKASFSGILTNKGTSSYNNVTIIGLTWTITPGGGTVTNATTLPLALGNLAAGASSQTVTLSANVPQGIPTGAGAYAYISGTAVNPQTGEVVQWVNQ